MTLTSYERHGFLNHHQQRDCLFGIIFRLTSKKTSNVRIPGPWFNIKMSSYQYRKSHCGNKTVVRSSYLHNGISYTGKMTSLYWFGPLVPREGHPVDSRTNKSESVSMSWRHHMQRYHAISYQSRIIILSEMQKRIGNQVSISMA